MQQLQDLASVDVCFMRVHADDESVDFESLEPGHVVPQVREIVGLDVVGVLVVDLVGQRPAFLFGAEPEQVLGQLNLRRQILRIELERLPLISGTLCKAIFLRQLPADEIVYLGILGPISQRAGAIYVAGLGIVFQVRQYGFICPRLFVPWIHTHNFIEKPVGCFILFAVDLMFG